MSSGDGAETEELIALFESLFINTCCPIAILTFLTYECLITFDREVALFWQQRSTGASVLFFTNRYLPILVNVLNLTSNARMSDASCDAYVKAVQTIQLLQYIPWAAFSALRTFALSGRKWGITVAVFLLSMVPVGINFSQYHWLVVINNPIFGCDKNSTITFDVAKRLTIASRTCLMAADVIVLLVTWISTMGTIRLSSAALKDRPSFARMLFRDGTVYFLILLVLNMLHLTFTMLSITNDSISQVSYFTTFTEPITAVLVSRFLLDLQQVNRYNQKSSPSFRITQSITLDLDWVVGSVGTSPDALSEDVTYASYHERGRSFDGHDEAVWDDPSELRTLERPRGESDLEGALPAGSERALG